MFHNFPFPIGFLGSVHTASSRKATPVILNAQLLFYISIHALLTEGDSSGTASTGPLSYFNPRPPHGGRPRFSKSGIRLSPISIHALLTEGDCHIVLDIDFAGNFNPRPPHGGRRRSRFFSVCAVTNFNPRPPHGGRPPAGKNSNAKLEISIHALLTEGDIPVARYQSGRAVFQSTPSSRRVTV